MKLLKARIQNYRSVKDTGFFDLEELKTILVGPNEAGKTVILQALQQLNKPNDIPGFQPLRDYPRSLFNDITTKKVDPKDVTVVTGIFGLDEEDKTDLPEVFHNCSYQLSKNLDNKLYHHLNNAPQKVTYKDLKNDLLRICSHMDTQHESSEQPGNTKKPSELLKEITEQWYDAKTLTTQDAQRLEKWLNDKFPLIEEGNEKEEERHEKLLNKCKENAIFDEVLDKLSKKTPVFILFNNYFRVKPSIHLEHLAQRSAQNILDDEQYDYGNLCLLKLLGFSARELSQLGHTANPSINDLNALKTYKDKLDERSYKLNAASVQLTNEIKSVWNPNTNRPEADKLRVTADGQYLRVVVEDDLGVEIELDQRSEGFQWLVSFFVVFFAEAMDKHENAILLLDEPGLNLHGLKQSEFRNTISRLANKNQTIFTTHSPFLVGPDELDLVRVVEMKDRSTGTEVHTTLTSSDPAGLLPLQEALGYDLASSLFSQQRNLVLEGITDYWYFESVAELFHDENIISVDKRIALVFANSAGKVVYYATILHAHNLKVAALLDSDVAGDQAAKQENLVHALGNKNILRTKDFCKDVPKAEIEDMLRETLSGIVKSVYNIDLLDKVNQQPNRPFIELCISEIKDFSKYALAKAFVRWSRDNTAVSLSESERNKWKLLFESVNKALK